MTGQEREYWRLVRRAIQRHCAEIGMDRLSAADASALRHAWHRACGLKDSHTEWTNHDYSVMLAWLRAFVEGGDVAAALVDLDAARVGSIRKSCLWVISKFGGLAYWEPYAREQLGLETWEAVNWETIPTNILRRVAMTASHRARRSAYSHRVTADDEDDFNDRF